MSGEGKVVFPIIVPILEVEIKDRYLSDTAPTPAEGYEMVEIKDLGYTKLWLEFRMIEGSV